MLTPGQAHDLACAEPLIELAESRMPQLGTSGSMSGDGKRSAPILIEVKQRAPRGFVVGRKWLRLNASVQEMW